MEAKTVATRYEFQTEISKAEIRINQERLEAKIEAT
jgi:hypothetical protein